LQVKQVELFVKMKNANASNSQSQDATIAATSGGKLQPQDKVQVHPKQPLSTTCSNIASDYGGGYQGQSGIMKP
jgi:hypothetical protein